jgi:hypothetical protein
VLYEYTGIANEPNDEVQLIPLFDTTKIKNDFCCFNKVDNSMVVIEVKSPAEKAEHKTFGQILYYMYAAKGVNYTKVGEMNIKIKAIRGIILANKISDSLKELVMAKKELIKEEYSNIKLKHMTGLIETQKYK